MFLAFSISCIILSLSFMNSSLRALCLAIASCLFSKLFLILFPALFIINCQFPLYPLPPQRVHGRPSLDFPDPLHWIHFVLLSQWLFPFPPHTMQETLAPSGFLPVPEQKTHLFIGSLTSTRPVLLQTWQCDIGESKSKGSFPVPLQNAHLIIFAMIFSVW